MPSPLEALQRRFVSSALGEADPGFVSSVKGGGKLSAREAVEVYRGAYPARMSEALGETFEACWRVLGDEDFLAACKEFSRKTPSTSANLNDYGEKFPQFLKKGHGKHAPFIGDLGRLEWEYKNLFHTAPHKPVPAKKLAKNAHPGAVLSIGEAVKLLRFEHRVLDIWRRDRQDSTPLTEKDWNGIEHVVLFKNGDNEIKNVVVSPHALSTLKNLRGGAALGEAIAEGMSETAVTDLFSFLAVNGLVAEVE